MIPCFEDGDYDHKTLQAQKESIFGSGPGAFVIRNCFSTDTSFVLNQFINNFNMLGNSTDQNVSHPLQKDKITINAFLEKLAQSIPYLAVDCLTNPHLNNVLDNLLGFSIVGSLTAHTIKPHGKEQRVHTDFPAHIFSGPFWENSPEKFDKYINNYTKKYILPYTSVQVLIATMNITGENGATRIYPHSFKIDDIDSNIHNREWSHKHLPNSTFVELNPGDVLIFNRGVAHKGGENTTDMERNAIIGQWTSLVGLPQHAFDTEMILQKISKLPPDKVKEFITRIQRPFPMDTAHN